MKNAVLEGQEMDGRTCPYCGRRFQNRQAVQMHIFWKHRDSMPINEDQSRSIKTAEEAKYATNEAKKEDKKMSTEVVSFLKSDLDKLRADVERLGSEVSKISRIVSRPDGTYYCIGDTCVKIETLYQGLQDVQQRLDKFEKEFESGRKASIGELLKKDPSARVFIKSLAQQVASQVASGMAKSSSIDDRLIEQKVEEILNKKHANETQSKDDRQPKDRFYQLFLAKKGR